VRYGQKKHQLERLDRPGLAHPSIISITVCFVASSYDRRFHDSKMVSGVLTDAPLNQLWWVLSAIIACGRAGRRGSSLEFTKTLSAPARATSAKSPTPPARRRVRLNILSGLVAEISPVLDGPRDFVAHVPRICFAECGFPRAHARAIHLRHAHLRVRPRGVRFLVMAPVTIAVTASSVTDNAQSVYELSRIEAAAEHQRGDRKGISASNRISPTPSSNWKKATVRETLQGYRKPVLIAPLSSARPR